MVIQLAPNLPEAFLKKGQLHNHLGRFTEAQDAYQQDQELADD